jgi:SPP1 gp7 family putative phage head morphogenesis protein
MSREARARQAQLTREGVRTLDPVRPNVGLQLAYQRKLEARIDAMARSVSFWLKARYRANEPEMAADASPAVELRREVRRLARRWQRDFDKLSEELAEYFAKAAAERSDAQLAAMLRKRGMSVRFRPTRMQNDAQQAIIGENVGLIKSIPQRYMQNVETVVMQSVQAGRDLHALTEQLGQGHGITKRRAEFIARDQNNKATAVYQRVRQKELGITEAIWIHSGGGKHPRPEHLAFSGKRYNVETGAFLEGKWTWPGHEINCRCVSKSVIPGF